MEIHLKPELEADIERNVASGRYASAEAYLTEAIESLRESEDALEQQREKLELSWQQAERGELISLDEFRDEIKAFKADWIRNRQPA